ncbi:MAG: DNA polymerase Y family protein [Rhodomicrobium sp.]
MAKGQKRAMFVWLPNFAMTLVRLKKPPLAGAREPLALLEKHGAIRRIAALDEPAIRAGLYLHQPLADALAVHPGLVCADADPEAVGEALTALAYWAQRYTPATAPAPPCGLWLDITGSAHLWGGEDALAEDLIARLEARGIPSRAAIAPTFGAAYALAHHAQSYLIVPRSSVIRESASALIRDRTEARFRDDDGGLAAMLAPLPVERLRISEGTASVLRKLGLAAIGDAGKLPRAGLARRFPDLLPQLDKAMGLAPEAIEFLQPPTPFVERMRFAEPVSAPEDLERVAHKLLHGLCVRLQAKRQGGKLFEASFFRSDGGVATQSIKTALPVRDAERIFRLFREKLGLIDPGFGVDVVTVAALHAEPLEARQANILRKVNNGPCAEELAVLIDALENRLGEGRVYRLASRESYVPERAVKRTPVIPEAGSLTRDRSTPGAEFCTVPDNAAGVSGTMRQPSSWKGAALSGTAKSSKRNLRKDPGYRQAGSGMTAERPGMAERPIRLFPRPQPIEVTAAIPDAPPAMFRWRKVVHRVIRAGGPERISPEWWREGGDSGGDDGEVRDYYCVESAHGMRFWVFREGLYGGERLPRWFLHGVFA